MKPVLLLDMDGVVADFVAAYLSEIRQRCGTIFAHVTHANVTQWDIAQALGLTPEEKQVVLDAMHRPGVAFHLPVIPGAREGVRELQEHVDVVFVTDHLRRNPTWVHDRDEWIDMHFKGVPVVYTSHKQHVVGDLFVDDKPENVEKWGMRHDFEKALLWDAPWNQHAKDHHRVRGWAELLDEVQRQV